MIAIFHANHLVGRTPTPYKWVTDLSGIATTDAGDSYASRGVSMSLGRWVAVVFLVCAMPVAAPGQVQIQWKWKKGDKFYLETTSTSKQTMTIMGGPLKQESASTTVDSYKVVEMAADHIVLEKKVESVKVKTTGPGAGAADKMAQKLKGAIFTLTLDRRTHAISKVEGVSDFIKPFEDNPIVKRTIAATLNDDIVRDEQQNILAAFLPNHPVSKGQKWTRKSKFPMGPMGDFSADGQYTYQGKSTLNDKELDKIDATWTLTYTPPKDKAALPFEISKGDFKTAAGKGTYYFDASNGKLVHLDRNYNFKGTLTVSIIGKDVEMEMEMDHTAKIQLVDKPPGPE